MTMIITIGVAAEEVRLSVASEEVEASEEAEVLAAAASEEEWAEAAVPAPGSKTRNNLLIYFNNIAQSLLKCNHTFDCTAIVSINVKQDCCKGEISNSCTII